MKPPASKPINSLPLLSILCLLISATAIISCDDKDDDVLKGSRLDSFSHLEADKDSMYVGQITQVKAIYDGADVVFEWQASSGDILGSGHTVEFLAASCTEQQATITCKAKAENQTKTRSISIYIH